MKQVKPNKMLILLHSEGSPAGSLLTWCDVNQIPFELVDMRTMITEVLNAFSFEWLVILGGPQNVDEEAKYPWLVFEKSFIKRAIEENKKVLGICLGGQLIAEVLGARVSRSSHWEAGFHSVDFLKSNKLVAFSPDKQTMFHFHGYSFDLPPGAELIAKNSATSCQGYIYKNRVVGLQFHPETTKHWAKYCATDKSDPVPTGPFCQTTNEIIESLPAQEGIQSWFFKLLDQMKSL